MENSFTKIGEKSISSFEKIKLFKRNKSNVPLVVHIPISKPPSTIPTKDDTRKLLNIVNEIRKKTNHVEMDKWYLKNIDEIEESYSDFMEFYIQNDIEFISKDDVIFRDYLEFLFEKSKTYI